VLADHAVEIGTCGEGRIGVGAAAAGGLGGAAAAGGLGGAAAGAVGAGIALVAIALDVRWPPPVDAPAGAGGALAGGALDVVAGLAACTGPTLMWTYEAAGADGDVAGGGALGAFAWPAAGVAAPSFSPAGIVETIEDSDEMGGAAAAG